MSRPLILSNGRLLVGLDERGLVHDFYYPYVGQDNLTTEHSVHHKIGVWVDGIFSWVDEVNWQITYDLEPNALITNVNLLSSQLGISLQMHDFVDSSIDAFIRNITVSNLEDNTRDIRLFFHQVFQISADGRGDTAMYVPDPGYVYTYKGKIGLLSYCHTKNGAQFDQHAVGGYGVEGKKGTYCDAEDGELSGSNIEHGGVDSVLRLKLQLAPKSSDQVCYWTIAANSYDAQYLCEQAHNKLLGHGTEARESATRSHWANWLEIAQPIIATIPKEYRDFTKKSLMIIKAHIDTRGAILASADSSILNYGRDYYCYSWPRDAAFALWPLIRLGYVAEAKQYFIFCRDVITKGGYLKHKYLPDRSVGSTWHASVQNGKKELAIQEDETAIIIAMLSEYLKASDDTNFVASLYADLVKPMADFLADFIDEQTNLPHASFDLWEEKFLTNTYTVAVTEYALYRAAELAKTFNHNDDATKWTLVADKIKNSQDLLYNPVQKYYRKGFLLNNDDSLIFDETIDTSSLYGMLMFSSATDRKAKLASTATAIEQTIMQAPAGGATRYNNDSYMRSNPASNGNPWFVCTLWMAQYYAHTGQQQKTKDILDWVMRGALAGGVLSEQIDPKTGQPISVAPLVWSHAEFINTALDLEA